MNQLYAPAREKFLNGEFSWMDDQFGFLMVDANYVADPDVDYLVSQIPAGSIAYRHDGLTNKASTGGYAKADTIVCGELTHVSPVTQLVLFRAAKGALPEWLVAYMPSVVGLPQTFDATNTYIIPSAIYGAFFRI